MRSRASLQAHPIHPTLIPFPFAFLIGSFVFDLLGWTAGSAMLSLIAAYLVIAGLVMALVAAVPGAIDYFYTVPPHSSGKQRARRHAIANLSALALFVVAWLPRGFEGPATGISLLVELAGAAVLAYGGWQGGVLVSRNLIGVDHRQAQAGKWREVTVEARKGPVVVAANNELKLGQMKLVRCGDARIVLARTHDGYAAFDDRCSHRGGSLADGVLIDCTVQCLWHGSRFDCRSGEVTCGPATKPLRRYAVSEQPDGIAVSLDPLR